MSTQCKKPMDFSIEWVILKGWKYELAVQIQQTWHSSLQSCNRSAKSTDLDLECAL